MSKHRSTLPNPVESDANLVSALEQTGKNGSLNLRH